MEVDDKMHVLVSRPEISFSTNETNRERRLLRTWSPTTVLSQADASMTE
jgi:hypothetical protein